MPLRVSGDDYFSYSDGGVSITARSGGSRECVYSVRGVRVRTCQYAGTPIDTGKSFTRGPFVISISNDSLRESLVGPRNVELGAFITHPSGAVDGCLRAVDGVDTLFGFHYSGGWVQIDDYNKWLAVADSVYWKAVELYTEYKADQVQRVARMDRTPDPTPPVYGTRATDPEVYPHMLYEDMLFNHIAGEQRILDDRSLGERVYVTRPTV